VLLGTRHTSNPRDGAEKYGTDTHGGSYMWHQRRAAPALNCKTRRQHNRSPRLYMAECDDITPNISVMAGNLLISIAITRCSLLWASLYTDSPSYADRSERLITHNDKAHTAYTSTHVCTCMYNPATAAINAVGNEQTNQTDAFQERKRAQIDVKTNFKRNVKRAARESPSCELGERLD
jgi:hypothetical protein